MSNQVNSLKKGLTVKDLVTTGIFSAIFFVFTLVGGLPFAPNPVLTFYMPMGAALLCGPKVYPCGMLSGIVLSTTKVSEFLSAMNRIHAPKKLVIPLAVMLRYVPTIQEDWRFIKDAMRMRDVSPSPKGLLTHPAMTVECIYVPLMMAASKAADELSIASITRGIENPKPRTCLVQIHIGPADILAGVCFAAYLAVGLYWKGVFG